MHPHAGRGRQERIHALREQAQNHAAEDIAGTGRGQSGRCIAIDDGAAIGRRNHRVGSLQHDDRAAAARRGASATQFVARRRRTPARIRRRAAS